MYVINDRHKVDTMPRFAGGGDSGEAIETGADAPPEEEFPTEDLVLEGGALDDEGNGEGAHGEEVCARLQACVQLSTDMPGVERMGHR